MLGENLILENYDVKLIRLTHNKIELVRNWRNDPKIQQTMFFQDYITPEMQENWFNKINNNKNFYFIIEYNHEEIGLINVKDIDYNHKKGESGVFIYEDKYLGTDISYRAHILMFDYIFNELELDYLYAHIRPENKKAIRFVDFLGYKEKRCDEVDGVSEYNLTKEDYINNKNRKRFILKYNTLNNK